MYMYLINDTNTHAVYVLIKIDTKIVKHELTSLIIVAYGAIFKNL